MFIQIRLLNSPPGGVLVILLDSVYRLIRLALQEDIGRGDLTSEAIMDPEWSAAAAIYIKQPAVVAGLPVVQAVFQTLDPRVQVIPAVSDGTHLSEKALVCQVEGPALSVLSGERTALNFLARLTGIATATARAVAELEGTKAKLLDTRKTTPGWRTLEKYAVRMGGGHNHRFGLDDMILIKDNHIALAGSVREAVRRARLYASISTRVEVEVDTLSQLEEALQCDVDMILLDNMDCPTMEQAVRMTAGKVPLEASGNMSVERLRAVANTGVDYISMGALTHGATSVDVGLDITIDGAQGVTAGERRDGNEPPRV
jgi:nicotinate-nucleotide pyrophosphorylase (carboxylating)